VFGYQNKWGGRGFESRRAKARSSVGERQCRARKPCSCRFRGGRRNGALLCIQRVAGSTPALSTIVNQTFARHARAAG